MNADGKRITFAWSKEDLARLIHLREVEKKSWFEIASELGRKQRSARARYWEHTNSAKRKERIAAERSVERRAEQESVTRVPKYLSHTSITAMVFGDPLPGRSALDMKIASGREQ